MRVSIRSLCLAVWTCLVFIQALSAQIPPQARLVSLGELNTSSVPPPTGVGGGAATPANVAYFAATDPDHGTEVWRWAGSGAATLWSDTRPGPESGNPQQFTAVGSLVIWVADDGVRGPEIRGSQQLFPGSPLNDLQPGLTHPPPQILGSSGGVVWFSTPSVQSGRQVTLVWAMASFGNPVQVGTFERDSLQQVATVPGQPHLFFIARPYGSPTKYDLCRVNGTQSVQSIENLDPAATGATPPAGSYAATPGFVCYRQCSGSYQIRLLSFASGSPVTLTPQSDASTLPWFVSNGTDRVCFAGRTHVEGAELWTTLGTPATTTLLVDLVPGTASSNPSRLMMSPGNPGVFFQVDEGPGRDLYFMDAAAPRKLRSSVQGSTLFAIVDKDQMALDVPDGNVTSIWLADGATGAGQWLGPVFSSISRLWNPSTQMPPTRQLNVVGTTSAEGEELYQLRSSATLTLLGLKSGPASASPRNFFPLGADQLFVADTTQGTQNFRVAAAGSPVSVPLQTPADVTGGNASSNPTEFTECGGGLFFTAYDGTSRRLFVTADGQMNSAAAVYGIYEPEQLVRFQDCIFLLGRASANATGAKLLFQVELSGTNVSVTPYAGGTHPATTVIAAAGRLFFVEPVTGNKELLQNLLPDFTLGEPATFFQDSTGTGITQFTASSGHLYFSAMTAASGAKRVLWATNGTAAGTRTPSVTLEQPQLLGALGDACVFWNEDVPGQKHQIFVWNGDSGAGPFFLGQGSLLDAPERHRQPTRPAGVEMGGRFYFTSKKGALNYTDGVILQTCFSDSNLLVRAEGLATLNDRLVFTGTQPDNRQVLFTFNVVEGVTYLGSLPAQSLPCPLVRLGNNLWFTLTHLEDNLGNTDLWRTDGTPSGTLCALKIVLRRETASVTLGSFGSHLVLGCTGPQGHGGIEPMLLNHDATVPVPPTLTGARRGQSFSFTYADIVTGVVSDFDGDALSPLRLLVSEGTLTRNGVAVESSTALTPGDTFSWLPASGTGGLQYPFQLYTADFWQESGVFVEVRVDTPLDLWAQGHFSTEELADPAISGPEADPDGDGVVNALEFVFGRLPRTHTPEPACVPSTAEIPGGGRVVRFTFVRAATLTEGTVLTVETSPDLTPGSWQPVASKNQSAAWTGTATVTETTLPDTRVQVVVEFPAPATGQAFTRLSVGL